MALEQKCKKALETLDGDLAGTYKSLTEMSNDEINKLVEDHILYNEGLNKFLVEAGTYNDWPVIGAPPKKKIKIFTSEN